MKRLQLDKVILCFLGTCVLVFAILVAAPSQARADDGSEVCTYAFSLEMPIKQEVLISLPDGSRGTLGVEPVQNSLQSVIATRSNIDLGGGNGTWKVYWYTVALNTSYSIQISNYNIVRCFDNYSSGIGIVIDSCTLNWGKKWSQQTTRHHEEILQTSDTRFLNGNIDGKTLVTSVYYG